MSTKPEETLVLIADYFRYRLARENVEFNTSPELPEANEDAIILRSLCDKFEKINKTKIEEIVGDLQISRDVINKLMDVCAAIDEDNQFNSGRMIALLVYCCLIAVKCDENGMPQLIEQIVVFVTEFIQAKGGRVTLVNNGPTCGVRVIACLLSIGVTAAAYYMLITHECDNCIKFHH